MKKIFSLLFIISILLSFSSCKGKENDPISDAVTEIKEHWTQFYKDAEYENGHFEIKNTRVIKFKENSNEVFGDVDHIIEFVLYTDTYGSAPYYAVTNNNNSVTVYKDGTLKVNSNNLIDVYRSRYFSGDFAELIESIDDCGSKYNCSEKLN